MKSEALTPHLAQVNIARMKAPLESDVMAGFVARLEEINARPFAFTFKTSEQVGHVPEVLHRGDGAR